MPSKELPLHSTWSSEEAYVDSLLSFASSSTIFRNLCGGIHILDFLTREPDLYSTVLPVEWRSWFDLVDIHDLLDLLFREHVELIGRSNSWRDYARPPLSLLDYISMVRKHCLEREFKPFSAGTEAMPRHIAVGMKPKKIHEVSNFAAYVDQLSSRVSSTTGRPVSGIVDFGSGQNYLGRTLASPPYCHEVIAIERRHHNVTGAKGMDVYAKLAKRQRILRNKKEYREQLRQEHGRASPGARRLGRRMELDSNDESARRVELVEADVHDGRGSMTYIEHDIKSGYLEDVLGPTQQQCEMNRGASDSSSGSDSSSTDPSESAIGSLAASTSSLSLERSAAIPIPSPSLLVVSLHSCGNLLHHGIRSLTLNHSVSAVAMIGCCYNLMSERLGSPTYKLPTLRSLHPRLESTSSSQDPHGFPMSDRLCTYASSTGETGIRLNITSRMMAVQAPYNWGREDSEAFFTRHFYRALLQRILLDREVVKQSLEPGSVVGGTISGNSGTAKNVQGSPLIIGSLPKSAFTSFNAYVKTALAKLTAEKAEDAPVIHQRTRDLTEEVIGHYETDWIYARKNLAIIWSLMAFSAGVVESVIAVDRWLYLKEQECVEKAWVEPVFDYIQSPRNLSLWILGVSKQILRLPADMATLGAAVRGGFRISWPFCDGWIIRHCISIDERYSEASATMSAPERSLRDVVREELERGVRSPLTFARSRDVSLNTLARQDNGRALVSTATETGQDHDQIQRPPDRQPETKRKPDQKATKAAAGPPGNVMTTLETMETSTATSPATGNMKEDPLATTWPPSRHTRPRFGRSSSDALHRRILKREQVKTTPELLANAKPEARQRIIDWVIILYESEDDDEIEDD